MARWGDCSCGADCECGAGCGCGKTAKTDEQWVKVAKGAGAKK